MAAEVLILGAGLAGLTAARTLKAQGISVQVVEKWHSVGGRLSTRRIRDGLADTGTQFFTARTETFQKQIDAWMAAGLVRIWSHGWSDGSIKRTAADGHPRYIVQGGMIALMEHLAGDVHDIRLNTEIVDMAYIGQNWELTDTAGTIYSGQILLLTAPVPGALALLNKNNIPLTDADRAALERIEFGPCLTGLFVIEGGISLPEPGAVQDLKKPVYWLGDNQSKGISPYQCIVTAHVEARYSRQHFNAPSEETLAFIREALKPYLAPEARIVEQHLEKWTWSIPLTTHPKDFLAVENLPLYLAGDAFGGRGRVEGAYLSGLAAGNAIAKTLTR